MRILVISAKPLYILRYAYNMCKSMYNEKISPRSLQHIITTTDQHTQKHQCSSHNTF